MTFEPGEPLPGTNLTELAAAIRELTERVDLLSPPFPSEVRGGKAVNPERQSAFMAMPFGHDELEIVYEEFVRPVLEAVCEMSCIRGDDIFGSNVVMDDISTAIAEADVLVADLTGRNPNVFYEVGIAHALNKPVLLLAQSLEDVPFDLRHRRVLLYEYSPEGCKRLEVSIVDHIRQMLSRTDSAPA
jgi:hypothetical protein